MGAVYLSQFRKLGIDQSKIRIEPICKRPLIKSSFYTLSEDERTFWRSDAFHRLKELTEQESCKVIVPAGDEALRMLCAKSSLFKWHLSPIETTEAFGTLPAIPLLSPHYIMRIFADIVYISQGAKRIAELLRDPKKKPKERSFQIRPTIEEFHEWKEKALASKPEFLCLDIETSAGQITCIGFSINPNEAICVQTLPKDWPIAEEFYAIWKIIAELCESDIPKVNQNILYDSTYLSAYGIRVRNIQFDTMMAMRYLNPELKKGLDNCARLYAYEPYWKDEGKDWNSRQNIDQLYEYNCKDASVTLEIALAQLQELRERNELERFNELVMKLWAPVAEMCWTGFPVRPEFLENLRKENQEEIDKWEKLLQDGSKKYLGKEIKPTSPKQIKELLKAAGFRIPVKNGKESSDYESLLKLRMKAENSSILQSLIRLSKLQKQKSTYLNYRYDLENRRMFFSLYVASTETLRMAGGKDPWDRGLNVQTIPRGGNIKGQFGYD